MRSLEEVRADLARLRESAKQRHAQLQVQRDASFAPTDFMEMPSHQPAPEPAPGESADDSFAATAFLDFGNVKPRAGR
jgi:hypothetical protein